MHRLFICNCLAQLVSVRCHCSFRADVWPGSFLAWPGSFFAWPGSFFLSLRLAAPVSSPAWIAVNFLAGRKWSFAGDGIDIVLNSQPNFFELCPDFVFKMLWRQLKYNQVLFARLHALDLGIKVNPFFCTKGVVNP